MNDFIVWDNIFKVFLNTDNIFIDNKRNIYNIEDGDIYQLNNNEHSLHKNIGLKDINGKSIYADSSIVEFKNSQLWNKYNGIFFYNKERLRYQIKIIGSARNNEIIPYDRYCSDFKIIDTIQENKLGLIKT